MCNKQKNELLNRSVLLYKIKPFIFSFRKPNAGLFFDSNRVD